MTPADLRPESFLRYSEKGRAFAIAHIGLLRRLPPTVCPAFLREIQRLDTSFPAEVRSLERRCSFLEALNAQSFAEWTETLNKVHLTPELQASDWVNDPARFTRELTAYLWSSGQIDTFRAGSVSLLAGIARPENDGTRLTIVMAGAGVSQPHGDLFRKLRKRGVLLTGLDAASMKEQITNVFVSHASQNRERYQSWYVDGGAPLNLSLSKETIVLSYAGLDPLRVSILSQMEKFIAAQQGGAEEMRDNLGSLSPEKVNAARVTNDPVLQRFYTELFTESSGPQIFSTSFVQWAGRELARRAEPDTLLLRYVPRQRERSFDELIQKSGGNTLDPEGSLRDAEMGAYYNLLEMERITTPGKGTFVLWIEDTSTAILVGPHAPAGAKTDSFSHLDKALQAFG